MTQITIEKKIINYKLRGLSSTEIAEKMFPKLKPKSAQNKVLRILRKDAVAKQLEFSLNEALRMNDINYFKLIEQLKGYLDSDNLDMKSVNTKISIIKTFLNLLEKQTVQPIINMSNPSLITALKSNDEIELNRMVFKKKSDETETVIKDD